MDCAAILVFHGDTQSNLEGNLPGAIPEKCIVFDPTNHFARIVSFREKPLDHRLDLLQQRFPLTPRMLENQDFQLKVLIGNAIYLPLEMVFPRPLGEPARSTRLDLTLGVDTDGDGLPDAWEEALIALFGGSLEDINPEDDTDGDGISNRDEYLSGTFAFDPADGFRLSLTQLLDGVSSLSFMGIRGRTYSIQATSDFDAWTTVEFRVVSSGQPGSLQTRYYSEGVQILIIEVPSLPAVQHLYFRALVE